MVLVGPYGCVGRSWTTYLKKYFLASYPKVFIRTHCAVGKVWSMSTGVAPVAVKEPTGGPSSKRMRSCNRDAKGFARSKDTSFRSPLPLSLLLYAIPDGRPPGFTIVLIRQTNPTSLRLRALNRRLITRPDTKGIGLDLDSTDERAPLKALKRVSRWQQRENGKGRR